MMTNELRQYIQENLLKGYEPEVLKSALLSSGWEVRDVEEAFAEYGAKSRDSIADIVSPSSQTVQTNVREIEAASVPSAEESPFSVIPETSSASLESPQPAQTTPSLVSQAGHLHIGMNVSASIDDPSVREKLHDDVGSILVKDQKEGGSFKKIVLIVAIICALGVLGVAAVYAYQKFYAMVAPEIITPEEDIARAVALLNKVHSFAYTATTSLSIEAKGGEKINGASSLGAEGGNGSVEIMTYGASQMPDNDAITSTSSWNNTALNISGTFGSMSLKFQGSMEIRSVKDTLYFYIAEMPNIPFIDLKKFEKKWISIDAKTMTDFATTSLGTLSEEKNIPELSSENVEDLQLKMRKAYADAYQKHHPLSVTSSSDEEIRGVKTTQYAFTLDHDRFVSFMKEIMKMAAPFASTSDDLGGEQVFDVLKNVSGTVSVGKKDHLPYRLMLSLPYATTTEEMRLDMSFRATLDFYDFNKPISVIPPENSTPLSEIIKEYEAQLASARAITFDKKRINDLGMIQLANELYFNKYKKYAPTLGDLAKEGFLSSLNDLSLPRDPADNSVYAYVLLKSEKEYVLGVSIDDEENPLLKTDADTITLGIHGADDAGCRGEVGRHCYDIIGKRLKKD